MSETSIAGAARATPPRDGRVLFRVDGRVMHRGQGPLLHGAFGDEKAYS
jgi:hypothetical protein